MEPNLTRVMLSAAVLLTLVVAGCEPERTPPEEAATPPAKPDQPATPTPAPTPTPVEEPTLEAVGPSGVSAGHADAVDVGMAVLADGGNAVDAAVAAAYAISVVEPFASGVGGGGAALVIERGGDAAAYDYREVVPEDGGIPAGDTGIPGFVAGMEALHEAHGTGDVGDLIAPAISLARDGVATSGIVADQLRSAAHRLPEADLPHLFPDGAALQPGDALVQEGLASTLERLAEGGAQTFYEGELAEVLADRVDGIDTASLAAYEVQRSAPASGAFGEFEVLAAAPPLPGATLVQLLQIAEALGVESHEPGSADFIHAIATGWRLAEHVLQWEVGDPAFVDVPLDVMTDADRNAALAERLPEDAVAELDSGQRNGGLDGNTTHITVVDGDGTVVSMTNTLTNFWGSGEYELGFFLNDQLRRFDIGESDANDPAPGQRSVSWAAPVVVLDEERRPVLGIGTPGGRRIPIVLAQVIARWALHGQPLADAVDAPRFHAEDTELEVEQPLPTEVADALRGRGYTELRQPDLPYYWGSVQALEIDYDAEEIVGASDPRREGDWRAAAGQSGAENGANAIRTDR